ncbi:MAG TPA: hypothetical protein VGK74_02830 [Symbiobacteriaceae bacterium]|jgi:hypothetical protein
MITYTTIDGTVLGLGELVPEEATYFDRCVAAYRAGTAWTAFMSMVRGVENPLLRATGGIITQAVYDAPLFRAVHDLEDRLGIAQGALRWDAPLLDPLTDEWITVSQAAEVKGVSVQAIHGAIGRGELVATGTTRKQVSKRSLDAWSPVAIRQRAGQARADRANETKIQE